MDRKEAAEILYEKYSDNEFYYAEYDKYPKGIADGYQIALGIAIEVLQEPERKKGQWIILSSNEDSAVCKCSVCGEDFVFYNGEFFPNYCGDCGTDMREVRNNGREIDSKR